MNKGIMFFIGLMFGILICVLLFYFDVKIFESKLIPLKEKEVITRIVTDTVYLEAAPKAKRQIVENTAMDSASENNAGTKHGEDDTSIYETNFSFDGDEQDEVFSDQMLKTRIVKVKSLKQEVSLPDNSFSSFEIQQWSTPIKNKITYLRNQNMLKIKGLEIDHANVIFWNNVYYLEVNNRYYSIPEVDHFVKLNIVTIPQ